MKFGIIQCRKCNRAFGINLRFKSTSCPFCNLKLKIVQENIKYKSTSEKDLAEIISKINKKIQQAEADDKRLCTTSSYDFDKFNLSSNKSVKGIDNKENDTKVYEQLDPYERIALKYKSETESIQLLKKIIIDLGHELGQFSISDIKELFKACAFDENKIDDYIEQLKNLNLIYEPRTGNYRLIED